MSPFWQIFMNQIHSDILLVGKKGCDFLHLREVWPFRPNSNRSSYVADAIGYPSPAERLGRFAHPDRKRKLSIFNISRARSHMHSRARCHGCLGATLPMVAIAIGGVLNILGTHIYLFNLKRSHNPKKPQSLIKSPSHDRSSCRISSSRRYNNSAEDSLYSP